MEWRQANGMQLPSRTDRLTPSSAVRRDVLPDKVKAFSGTRVLMPGGVFMFNVWDRIRENEFADTVTTA